MSNSPESNTRTAHPGGLGELAGLAVSRIGYGAMQLERLAEDRSSGIALLRRAVDLGVDHIDTAEFYGNGFVNSLLKEALKPEDGVVIVSKVGADPDPGGPFPMRPAQRPEELRASVEDNLRSLGVDQIPVVNLRRMDRRIRIPLEPAQHVDIEDQIAAMTEMRDDGLIGAFGLSNVTLDGLHRAIPADVACVQNEYSLVTRDDEDMLELCAREGIAWVPYFPLGGAFAGMPKVTDQPAVQAAARSLDVEPSQVGLAWLLHHSPNVLLIPGTANLDHLEANLAIGQIELDETTLAALEGTQTR